MSKPEIFAILNQLIALIQPKLNLQQRKGMNRNMGGQRPPNTMPKPYGGMPPQPMMGQPPVPGNMMPPQQMPGPMGQPPQQRPTANPMMMQQPPMMMQQPQMMVGNQMYSIQQ